MSLHETLQTVELVTRIVARCERSVTRVYRYGLNYFEQKREKAEREAEREANKRAFAARSPAKELSESAKQESLIRAMVQLGYSREDAARRVKTAMIEMPDAREEDIIKFIFTDR